MIHIPSLHIRLRTLSELLPMIFRYEELSGSTRMRELLSSYQNLGLNFGYQEYGS